jgi:hypothetical protein
VRGIRFSVKLSLQNNQAPTYQEVLELKQSRNGATKNILVGSPGLIGALTQPDLGDEYQPGVLFADGNAGSSFV